MLQRCLRWGCALLVGVLATVAFPAAAADVIVNAARPDTQISRSLVRGMFGMRLRAWPDGAPVRVFVLADNDPLHVEFAQSVLQIYPYQLRQNWDRLVYSGTGQPPITVSSEEEMIRRVEETPGSIGYLGRLKPNPSVRVLHVR